VRKCKQLQSDGMRFKPQKKHKKPICPELVMGKCRRCGAERQELGNGLCQRCWDYFTDVAFDHKVIG